MSLQHSWLPNSSFTIAINDALIAECILCGKPAGSAIEITSPSDTWKPFVHIVSSETNQQSGVTIGPAFVGYMHMRKGQS